MSSLARTIARNIARHSTQDAVSKGMVKCPKCGKTLKLKHENGKDVVCACGWRGRIR